MYTGALTATTFGYQVKIYLFYYTNVLGLFADHLDLLLIKNLALFGALDVLVEGTQLLNVETMHGENI